MNIKFRDDAIDKIITTEEDQSFFCKKSNTIKTRTKLYVPFDVDKNTHLKGLKLCINLLTKSKTFTVQFWHNNKSNYYVIGKYIKNVFMTKDCSNKLFEIYKEHTENGKWIKSPLETDKEKKRLIPKTEIYAAQNKTICEVIEEYFKAGMPKILKGGCLGSRSASHIGVYLIGYNKRMKVLKFQPTLDNENQIIFKPKMWGLGKKRKNANPTNFDELFKRYPSGNETQMIKGKVIERSLYDSEFGKTSIKELNQGDIRKFISKYTYGTQKHWITVFNYLWAFAAQRGFLGDRPPINPTLNYNINKERVKNFAPTRNKAVIFGKEQTQIIWEKLTDINTRLKFPFAAECLALMLLTGLREEEALRIKKKDLSNPRFITVAISKLGTKETIPITPQVRLVLNMLNEIEKRPGNQWVSFVPWLFCTPKFRTKNFEIYKDTDLGKNYINSVNTRLGNCSNCWMYVREEIRKILPNFVGSPKNFRKNYASAANKVLKNPSETIRLTRHQMTATLEKHYIGQDLDQNMENAERVSAEFFDFVKLKAV
jgi:integrase